MRVQVGDVFVTQGTGLLAALILKFQTEKNEKPSVVNHTGFIVSNGELPNAILVEANHKIRKGTFEEFYGPNAHKTQVAVFRRRDITSEQKAFIRAEANRHVGETYGYIKILGHAGDYYLSKLFKRRVTLFRSVFRAKSIPICSYFVGDIGAKLKWTFKNRPVRELQPDDVWDECTENTDEWECVQKLTLYMYVR
jgi:hypothetical protein